MEIKMPKIALGAWSWGAGFAGGDQVFGNSLFEEELKPVFDMAMSLGLNLWDTAAVYGEGTSERILGNFIKTLSNIDDIIISTKFTPQIAGKSDNPIEKMLDKSKKRLHTDKIDIYWIHNPLDFRKWINYIIPIAKDKQVKNIGLSNFNMEQIKEAEEILAKEGLKISAIQNHFSLLNRFSENSGILKYSKDKGITFFSYMVLEQGALTGKYNVSNPFKKDTARDKAYNSHLKELEALIEGLKTIGKKYNASPAQVSIAWAISKGTLPIIGVTKVHQVEEAKEALNIILKEDEIKYLEKLADDTNIQTVRDWEENMK
ncbi:aldo/keto reductase [Brachyspira innocens]|uniref:aldo/keto reductase n=1 Tax=Brachyspira innocens TaxID=13264 RepID=UPI0026EC7AE9|nr:aldo/keto reductase [Brachyspira innocens]